MARERTVVRIVVQRILGKANSFCFRLPIARGAGSEGRHG